MRGTLPSTIGGAQPKLLSCVSGDGKCVLGAVRPIVTHAYYGTWSGQVINFGFRVW